MGDPLTVVLSLSALLVSVLAVIVPALTGRQQRLRDDRAKRSEMYLELMELVETYGLWVVDRTYDLMETSHDDFRTEMPHRRTPEPDRTRRVRARAIVSAYASTSVANAFTGWQSALERFEEQRDLISFVAHEEGPYSVNLDPLVPARDAEVAARGVLADAVNVQLVKERRLQRGAQRPQNDALAET